MGCAVKASVTVTFVGLKQGLFLGVGPEHAGDICFSDLNIPPGDCSAGRTDVADFF